MPTIEYRMDTTGIPHTYIVINNGAGVTQMYGFAPAVEGNLWGTGHIYDESVSGQNGDTHPWDHTTDPIEVTVDQYNRVVAEINNAIANPPYYSVPASIAWPSAVNQCATWVNHLADVGGFADKLPWGGNGWNPWGQSVWTEVSKYWKANPFSRNDFGGLASKYGLLPVISPTLANTPDPKVKVKVVRYVDPLILDLDGDGLEITPLSKGVLFDANGDTIKTGTAWVGVDDGLLVWDRNGNGQIDSGAELFGDETILSTGINAGKKAADGFIALAELDTNVDGKFDAADTQYTKLRIWRDLNQDGINQAGELQTLADSKVQSITLASTVGNTPGNATYTDAILTQKGSFTRTDGSIGQAGSFILAQNNFVRAFAPIAVSADAKALNSIGGSGWVRDLQEAATQSSELISVLNSRLGASNNWSLAQVS